MLGRYYVRQHPSATKTFKYRHMCNMVMVGWDRDDTPPRERFELDTRFQYSRSLVAEYLMERYDNDTLDIIHAETEIRFPVRKGRPPNSLCHKTIARLNEPDRGEYKEQLFGRIPPPPPPPDATTPYKAYPESVSPLTAYAEAIEYSNAGDRIHNAKYKPQPDFSIMHKDIDDNNNNNNIDKPNHNDYITKSELASILDMSNEYVTKADIRMLLTELQNSFAAAIEHVLASLDVERSQE